MRLGRILKAYREAERLSIREMAQEIGIAFSTYARIESGKTSTEVEAETWIIVTNWLAGK
jgi:transcriptional regulator with XRE-family HTH domain